MGTPQPLSIIFGGSGFIGTHLGRWLHAQGHEVVVLDNRPRRDVDIFCDVRRPIRYDPPRAPDRVYNLAAIHRSPGHEASEYFTTNALGAINVTRWATEHAATDLCFTSSIAVYGPAETQRVEQSDCSPSSPYGHSKLIAEEIHRDWASSGHRRRLSIVRPAVIFGSGEGGNFTRLARALRNNRFIYPGRKDTVKAAGYVKDLVRAMHETPGGAAIGCTFNFSFPEPYTVAEICEAFQSVAGYKSPPSVPSPVFRTVTAAMDTFPGRAGRALTDRARKLVVSTDVKPSMLMRGGFQWRWPDLRSALSDWSIESAGSFQ